MSIDVIAYEGPHESKTLRKLVPELRKATGLGIPLAQTPGELRRTLGKKRGGGVVVITDSNFTALRTSSDADLHVSVYPLRLPQKAKVGTVAELLRTYGARVRTRKIFDPAKRPSGASLPTAQEHAAKAALPVFEHAVRELHSPETGRLDAARIANLFGIKLPRMAELLGRKYPGVRKTPDSEALQPKLQRYARIAQAAAMLIKDTASFRIWLHAPHPDLDHTSPLDVLADGRPDVVVDLLEDALVGHPG